MHTNVVEFPQIARKTNTTGAAKIFKNNVIQMSEWRDRVIALREEAVATLTTDVLSFDGRIA